MGNVFEKRSYRHAFGRWPPLSEAGYLFPVLGGRDPPQLPLPLQNSPQALQPQALRGRDGAERPLCSSGSSRRRGPVFAATKGRREGNAGSPLRLLEAAREGVRSSAACLSPSILHLLPPCREQRPGRTESLERGGSSRAERGG